MKNSDQEKTVFQKRLIALRESEGFTQSELAKVIGVSRSSVRDWESGDKMPGAEMLIRIADFFGVTIDYLLGRESLKSVFVGQLSEEAALKLGEFLRSL